jgi:hypothetical protein
MAVLGLLLSAESQATMVDLRSTPAVGPNSGFGNTLSFAVGSVSVDVTSYGATGSGSGLSRLFETARAKSWETGIGVCNRSEQSGGCSDTEHEVDTNGRDDLVVFSFNQLVNFQSLTVDPYNSSGSSNDSNDRDIRYWVTNSLPTLTAESFSSLATLYGPSTLNPESESYSPATHALAGTGTFLLLAGDFLDLNCDPDDTYGGGNECEAYKIANIGISPVPLPTAAVLLGSGLLGFGFLRRRAAA